MEAKNGAQVLVEALMIDDPKPGVANRLNAIYCFLREDSSEATFFEQIVDELLKVDPRHYLRVRDYFFSLNDNLERGGVPDPRAVGQKLLEQAARNDRDNRSGCK
jgi:hypothetical protein